LNALKIITLQARALGVRKARPMFFSVVCFWRGLGLRVVVCGLWVWELGLLWVFLG